RARQQTLARRTLASIRPETEFVVAGSTAAGSQGPGKRNVAQGSAARLRDVVSDALHIQSTPAPLHGPSQESRMYDAFLNLLPSAIKGESQKQDHELEVDLIGFSWGAMNNHAISQGTGMSTGKVKIQEFSVLKYVDAASPVLFHRSCT